MPRQTYLEAGKIVGTHGVRGELRVQPWCDSPQVFASLKTLYFDKGTRPVRVQSRPHKNIVLVKMEGVDTVGEAAALRDKVLYLHRDDLKLEPGRHFIQDLIGLRVVDADTAREYGRLTDVSATGANDVYHMRTEEGKEILIPVIPQVVTGVDIDAGRGPYPAMPGLLDEDPRNVCREET